MIKLGMREEHWTGLVRGLATGGLMFSTTTLTAYSTTQEWSAAVVTGGIAGLTALGSFYGLGVRDARRNDKAGETEDGP